MRLWAALVILSTVGVLGLGTYAGWNLRDMPQRGNEAAIVRTTEIYDRSGQLIAQRSADGLYHIYTPLSQLGTYGPDATLAAEDRGFYQHAALDGPALVRAAATDAVHGHVVEGGSTITQQLVKLTLLGPEQTFSRKLQEGFLAWAMERRYSKGEILEMYLNRVYYGYGAYGLTSAVKTYFGRDTQAADLDPAQAAFLAGLLAAPSGLDPRVNFDGARARQLYVLDGLRAMRVITQAQEDQAVQEDIRSELKYDVSYRASGAPHYVDWVMAEAEREVGTAAVQQGGLRIYTTLDSGLQAAAEQAVASGVRDLGRYGVNNGALLAARAQTGEVLAWVGSADYGNDAIGGQYDVVRSPRQPGSSFKPYVYESALIDHKITLCSTVQDVPTDFNGYRPQDWDDKFMGPMTAARALLLSRNVPAVQVAQEDGMSRIDGLAHRMGITTPLDTGLASAIGGQAGVELFDQVQGYAVFADQGRKMPLMGVTRIVDGTGQPIFQQQPGTQPGQQTIVSAAQAYLITSVLQGYQRQWGLGWSHQMASKSGTTGSFTGSHPDAWMMAYNPDVVVGAWAGNTGPNGNGSPTNAYGTYVGSTISARFINKLPSSLTHWYSRPGGLVQKNGLLFLPGTQDQGC